MKEKLKEVLDRTTDYSGSKKKESRKRYSWCCCPLAPRNTWNGDY